MGAAVRMHYTALKPGLLRKCYIVLPNTFVGKSLSLMLKLKIKVEV